MLMIVDEDDESTDDVGGHDGRLYQQQHLLWHNIYINEILW